MDPKLSIIMPIYNGGRYLIDSLGGLEKIKLIPWELLIVDDGSTDNNTRYFIESYAEKDDRIKPSFSNINRGISISRNELINRAQSDTILVLDVDNVFDEGIIEKMYAMLKSLNVNVVCTQYLKWIKNYNPLTLPTGFGEDWNYLKYGNQIGLDVMIRALDVPPCSGNYMYTRRVFDSVGGYHDEDYHEAWGFGFRHIAAGYPIWICPGTHYNHRVCSGNYDRLPKPKIKEAMWSLLNSVRDRFTEDTVGILDQDKDGDKIISSGALKLK